MTRGFGRHRFYSFSVAFSLTAPAFAHGVAEVCVPVADLRSEPVLPRNGLSDTQEETQLLLGEEVWVYESSGPWAHVEAVEQPQYRQNKRWEGYPGWVLKKALSPKKNSSTEMGEVLRSRWILRPGNPSLSFLPLGARVDMSSWPKEERTDFDPVPLQPSNDRAAILASAKVLIGVPYVWGGLSPGAPPLPNEMANLPLGIDCSGLTYLAYRLHGRIIPRDSHEQWMKARPIKRTALQTADLIFSAHVETPQKIVHVVLYAGDGEIVEAPQAGMTVHEISFKEKFGRDLSEVESGDTVGDHVLYFGTFIGP